MCGKKFPDAVNKARLLQLERGHVHADGNIKSLGQPALDVLEGFVDDPFTDVDGKSVALDDREELPRRQQARKRMLPSDETFRAQELAGPHVHFGLEVQHKFFGLQSIANALDVLVMPSQVSITAGVEEVKTTLSLQLGLIHGLIRLAKQLIGVHVFRLGEKSDADAG